MHNLLKLTLTKTTNLKYQPYRIKLTLPNHLKMADLKSKTKFQTKCEQGSIALFSIQTR